jgi:hypothetical protein
VPFPVGDSDFEAAESALGVRFPVSFRTKMLSDNGGEFITEDDDFELFRVLDRSDRKRMARTSSCDIVKENASAREWPGFPDDAIAIGANGAGDYLVFIRAGDLLGDELFVWQHETGSLSEVEERFPSR